MSNTASLPAASQIARFRQRTYLVEQVVKPKRVADRTLIRLSGVDDDNQPLEVLGEKVLDATILTSEAWKDVSKKGFDDARLLIQNCVIESEDSLWVQSKVVKE